MIFPRYNNSHPSIAILIPRYKNLHPSTAIMVGLTECAIAFDTWIIYADHIVINRIQMILIVDT